MRSAVAFSPEGSSTGWEPSFKVRFFFEEYLRKRRKLVFGSCFVRVSGTSARREVLVSSIGTEVGGAIWAESEGRATRARVAWKHFLIAPTVADVLLMSKKKRGDECPD